MATNKTLSRMIGDATTIGKALLLAATAAAARTTLELGALALKATVNDADWSGADLAVANGGTGSSTAAAARTALGLGAVAVETYVTGTITPTITFATPGDVSVAYVQQNGNYTRIGNRVFFNVNLQCTPTYTTAAGALIIGGLPIATAALAGFSFGQLSRMTYAAGELDAHLQAASGATTVSILLTRSANTVVTASVTNFPSGTEYIIRFSGSYEV